MLACLSALIPQLMLSQLITNDDMGRWNRLCMGSKLLIQESDPSRFLAPFERSMLESQRAWFVGIGIGD